MLMLDVRSKVPTKPLLLLLHKLSASSDKIWDI